MWNILDKYFHSIQHFQTNFGLFWYANMYLCRLFAILVIGEELFDDALKDFVCDTQQPGCRVACFNDFVPIALNRFWGAEVLFCSMPILGYYFYAFSLVKMINKLNRARIGEMEARRVERLEDSTRTILPEPHKTSHEAPGSVSINIPPAGTTPSKININPDNSSPFGGGFDKTMCGRGIISITSRDLREPSQHNLFQYQPDTLAETGFETKHGRRRHRKRRRRIRNYKEWSGGEEGEEDVIKLTLERQTGSVKELEKKIGKFSTKEHGHAQYSNHGNDFMQASMMSNSMAFSAAPNSGNPDPTGQRYDPTIRPLNSKPQMSVTVLQPFYARKLDIVYIITCVAKILSEFIFIALSYVIQFQQSRILGIDTLDLSILNINTLSTTYNKLQKVKLKPFLETFTVPEKYECNHGERYVLKNLDHMSPCSQQKVVNCWVVRKTEKEIFLRYMILMQFVSIGISVADIIVMLKKLRRNRSRSRTTTTKKSARKRVDKDIKSALPKHEQPINCCFCRRKKATSANNEQVENKTFKLSNSSSENDNVFSNDSSSSSK